MTSKTILLSIFFISYSALISMETPDHKKNIDLTSAFDDQMDTGFKKKAKQQILKKIRKEFDSSTYAQSDYEYSKKLIRISDMCTLMLSPLGNFLYEAQFRSALRFLQASYIDAQMELVALYKKTNIQIALNILIELKNTTDAWTNKIYNSRSDREINYYMARLKNQKYKQHCKKRKLYEFSQFEEKAITILTLFCNTPQRSLPQRTYNTRLAKKQRLDEANTNLLDLADAIPVHENKYTLI